jgi:hypothetical protein
MEGRSASGDGRLAPGDRPRSTARYSKHEIGSPEAPYDVLIGVARLSGTDLDYLIAGDDAGGISGSALEEPDALLEALPLPAVVFDQDNKLLAYNALYPGIFPRELRRLVKRGTPQEVLLRAWARVEGCTTDEADALVADRLSRRNGSQLELRVGSRRLRISERVDGKHRLAVISELTDE